MADAGETDSLSAHLSAQKYLERYHSDKFVFEYFPSYCPELNPVEQCRHWMKNVYMVNFVPKDDDELHEKTFDAGTRLFQADDY